MGLARLGSRAAAVGVNAVSEDVKQALARPKAARVAAADTKAAAAAAAASTGRTASPPRLAAEKTAATILKQRAKTAKPG